MTATAENTRRYPPRPVLGVGALIFDNGIFREQRILLVKRGREPLAGYWSLPGGCVETGEGLEQAVAREVFEETGLRVSVGPVAAVFERLMPDATGRCEYHYVLIDFYCTPDAGLPRPGDDSSDVAWFSMEDLPALKLTEGTLAVILDSVAGPKNILRITRP